MSPSGADETFDLTDVQAEAILNMRLRALRKLEEWKSARSMMR
jgi:DNA gyrase/topoisomerase IV subunit A